MLYNKIYTDFINARKEKNELAKNILGLLYNSLKNKTIELRTDTLEDSEVYNIIRKLNKQLDEEIEANVKVNRIEKADKLTKQKELIKEYLPKQLSEDKIRELINDLADKSIPSIMKFFKTNYNGQVDMALVSKIARENN